jgi:hypothetical protein
MATAGEIVTMKSSSIHTTCDVCNEQMSEANADDYFVRAVNHYLGHGFKILHVGQESDFTDKGEVWQMTVAVLSKQM